MLLSFVWLIVGLVILYYGAEFLVAGASNIALSYGISPMIVGLTVVAFATSAPEFVVSLTAALAGSPKLALGNVVGSNVANIALIVGVASLIFPMAVERSVFVRDYPTMVFISVAAIGLGWWGGAVERGDGIVLLAILLVFLSACVSVAVKQNREFKQTGAMDAISPEQRRLGLQIGRCVVGLVGLVVGADLMVDNAVEIARSFEIDELVIGVSIVAIGTSLPELATSVVAALRKEADISLGNIIGSNVFNVGFILGGVSLIRPIPVDGQALHFDLPVMLLVSLLLFPLMRISMRVTRIDGALLTITYFAYLALTYLVSIGRVAVPGL